MTELILIRHGQTDSNLSRRFQGHSNTFLNDEGRRQALRLAARLRASTVHALYSSDLERALETARILGRSVGCEAVAQRDLREIDVGEAVGWNRDELHVRCPQLFGDNWEAARFPGGESYADLGRRVERALRDLVHHHSGGVIAVVTHGGVIRVAVSLLAGWPLTTLRGLVVANTSLTRFDSADGSHLRLRVLNDAGHLESWAASLERDAL